MYVHTYVYLLFTLPSNISSLCIFTTPFLCFYFQSLELYHPSYFLLILAL